MNQVLYFVRGEIRLDVVYVLCCGNEEEVFQNNTTWRMNHFVLIIDLPVTQTSTPTSSEQGLYRDPQIEQEAANFALMPISENPLFDNFSMINSLLVMY